MSVADVVVKDPANLMTLRCWYLWGREKCNQSFKRRGYIHDWNVNGNTLQTRHSPCEAEVTWLWKSTDNVFFLPRNNKKRKGATQQARGTYGVFFIVISQALKISPDSFEYAVKQFGWQWLSTTSIMAFKWSQVAVPGGRPPKQTELCVFSQWHPRKIG